VDRDEHDVGILEEVEPRRISRQERRSKERRNKLEDSCASVLNDTSGGHLPLHIENEIDGLESLLETCDPAFRGYLQSCLYAARRAIDDGTVDEPGRKKYWKDWCSFTSKWNVSPFLEGVSKERQADILTSFAVGVREGHYGRGNRITAHSVDRAIPAVGQTFQLASRKDPTKIDGGHERILPLGRQIASYCRADPPPKPQLAIPVSVIEHMQEKAISMGHASRNGAVIDLCTLHSFSY